MSKATPGRHLGNAAGITYGTALSSTPLNATAAVSGTFVYTPAAGAVLSAGAAQTLSVTFTPTDAANYATAAGTWRSPSSRRRRSSRGSTPANITYGTRSACATERVRQRGRHVRLHAGGRDRALGWRGAIAVGDLHAEHREFPQRHGRRVDHSRQDDPGHHLGRAGDIVYGNRARRDPVERNRGVPARSSTHSGGDGPDAGAAQSLSVTFTPTDGANTDGEQVCRDHVSRRPRSSPGRTPRTSSTAPR